MKKSHLVLLAVAAVLAACSSSQRPTYSGREESTEGVPGFVNGKKVSPHVKLGQSYTVGGETYTPRNQPDYVEEGMASWYGPGFHGGKTANGERFDSAELTAAHRTLPLPSIVRVTMISTGKQVYVRVNDRGPFAHSRIIDLSRGAAEKIGLLRSGVAKVRVEYMAKESRRFTELLATGRDPKSIDVASEVLNYDADRPTQYGRGDVRTSEYARWDDAAPAGQEASEQAVNDGEEEVAASSHVVAAPVSDVVSADLPVAKQVVVTPKPQAEDRSPFAAVAEGSATASASVAPAAAPVAAGSHYIQLGAFSKIENAERLRNQYSTTGTMEVVQKANAKGQMLYHVRMGPFANQQAGNATLDKLRAAGVEARLVRD